MNFDRIRLENFKCFADAELRLDRGVTVIHGLNGSGKSSLLEACFFALYGARAIEKTLDEVVTIGAEEATVELEFTHGGRSYRIERRVRVRDDRASTAKCVLETPDGPIEGARDVGGYVAELLRMDADAFVNCAYVRQGEVNKLINATPGERQDTIDELLQLGKLEEYRERASDARLGVERVRDDKRGALSQVEEQIENKERKDPHEQLNALESRLAELESEIDHYEEQREAAVETREGARSVLEAYEQKRERLADLTGEIEELTGAIQETEREREQLRERIGELRSETEGSRERRDELLAGTDVGEPDPGVVADRIAELESRDERLRGEIEDHRLEAKEHADRASVLREGAEDLESRAREKSENAAELETELEETEAAIAEQRERIEEIAAVLEEKREAFADAPVDPGEADEHRERVAGEVTDLREREAELEATLEAARGTLAEAEDLLAEEKCPECGQPVEGSPHVESIDEYRERVADLEGELEAVREQREDAAARLERAEALSTAAGEIRELAADRENAERLVDEREEGLEDTRARIADLREDAAELEAEAERKRAEAETAEEAAAEHRESIGEYNERRGELDSAIERLEAAADAIERVDDLEDETDRLRERRANKEDVNDERRERLADKREAKADLEAEFDDEAVERAREERDRAAEYIEDVDGTLDDLREERDEVTGRIGAVGREIEELEQLRDRRDELAGTVDRLESLHEEATQLQETYGQLRAELRRRNVETLERMLNETFELVYQNDSYARIELDGEYELTVYQKDGEPLDPEQLSGGERALFNLSLRCAIYRLLAEGIEGTAPMPPLILDEPTVFLDSGHVSQLVELIEAMRELGVDQIVVVSHDEALVGAADDLVTVRKDATTNRSTVERERSGVGIPAG